MSEMYRVNVPLHETCACRRKNALAGEGPTPSPFFGTLYVVCLRPGVSFKKNCCTQNS
jgi:hypothetical protein